MRGKAESCNNLAFCAFMRMDFELAVKMHREVYNLTHNEVELLIADVGLMRIYQRTALYKEFYDYRNSALRRIKRLSEDANLFTDKHDRARLNYAKTEFSIVSAIYYYYLQQRPEAINALTQVDNQRELLSDTGQLLYYHYIRGTTKLCDKDTKENQLLCEFDEVYRVWDLASKKGYLYFEGNSIHGLADLMASRDNYEFFKKHRLHALQKISSPVDSLFPLRLGQLALQKLRRYDDLYQIAGTYVTIGKYLNLHGRYNEALDSLQLALECVNNHHRRYYLCNDTLDRLKMHDEVNASCVEKKWLEYELKTAPEWILRIREQLSVSYAGMGMKTYSDYNRNIYLDILEDIRQNKELEIRYQALEKEARLLNLLLISVIIGFVIVSLLWGILNKRSKKKNQKHLRRLQLTLDICQKITTSIPDNAQNETEITNAIQQAVLPDLETLFGMKGILIENRNLVFPQHITTEERAMVKVITPYIQWALDNGMTSAFLDDECRRIEKQRYVYEQHIAVQKRQNIVKRTCLSIVNGIHPYIDRIIHEVSKLQDRRCLTEIEKKERYLYINELINTINEQNEILSLWVKLKQGTINLKIENFELNELFDLLRKGNRAFEMKQQKLEIITTDACVKADKALTLFMVNTLAENARKYTPVKGWVKIYAVVADKYVEISVEDNGYGLSPKDVTHIMGDKIYDSKTIGLGSSSDNETLKKNKGSGFGLMNCKGIIEKYRKTSNLFKVCSFGVESVIGKGSRFYFRLPVGIKKTTIILLAAMSLSLSSCGEVGQSYVSEESPVADSLLLEKQNEYEDLLDIASDFADDAYFCNIDRAHELALQCVDSAMHYLNMHYEKYAHSPHRFMTLVGKGEPAELDWWREMFDSDFHIILDIRNEAAVAFLALRDWDSYDYNNSAYTSLYKLLGEDLFLEEYCNRLKRSSNNKQIGISLSIILLIILFLGYYIFYFRKRLVNRWNLEQVLEINQQVFKASQLYINDSENVSKLEEERLSKIPYLIAEKAFDSINDLLGIDGLYIAVYNEATNKLEYASNLADGEALEETAWGKLMYRSFTEVKSVAEGKMQAFPLHVEIGNVERCIGVLCLIRREDRKQDGEDLLLELIVRYVSIVIFNSVVKLIAKYRDIEEVQDEARRASWEDSQLHVQNMVLDNCLSTIKHETVYYPNRIKHLMTRLVSNQSDKNEDETIMAVGELIEYYKAIFTILSSCAARQLGDVTFRRSTIAISELTSFAIKYFNKVYKGKNALILFKVESLDEAVTGDINLLHFLLESLIDEALSFDLSGIIKLIVTVDGKFIRFSFTDLRRKKTREELQLLFFPVLHRMNADGQGNLHGTEYLICKQIIREHDEFAGYRGCRINAEPVGIEGGFTVYFTIPRKKLL